MAHTWSNTVYKLYPKCQPVWKKAKSVLFQTDISAIREVHQKTSKTLPINKNTSIYFYNIKKKQKQEKSKHWKEVK